MKPDKNICKAEIDFESVERFFAKYSSKCRYSVFWASFCYNLGLRFLVFIIA